MRGLSFYFGSLCFLLTCVLPLYYLFTGDYALIEKFGFRTICFILVLQFPVIPIGLLLWLSALWRGGFRPDRFAAITGLALGMWLTTLALGVPYCGFYPNLLPLFILFMITDGKGIEAPDPRLTFAVIFTVNLVVYPLFFWLPVRVACLLGLKRPDRESDAPEGS